MGELSSDKAFEDFLARCMMSPVRVLMDRFVVPVEVRQVRAYEAETERLRGELEAVKAARKDAA